jgi:site-specific DNA recombinase
MSPTHANKKGTRYRYYISRSLLGGPTIVKAGQRLPAVALESLVIRRIRDWLADPATLLQLIQAAVSDAPAQKPLLERARAIAAGESSGIHTFMRSTAERIQVHSNRIDIGLNLERVRQCLEQSAEKLVPIHEAQSETDRQIITLSIPARLKRTGKEMRIVVTDDSSPTIPDGNLVRLLVRAYAIREKLLVDRSLTFEDLAKSEAVVPSYATRLFRLTVLAPDIVSAILNGRHPTELTARRLMDDTRLPLDWNEQRRSLGFAST